MYAVNELAGLVNKIGVADDEADNIGCNCEDSADETADKAGLLAAADCADEADDTCDDADDSCKTHHDIHCDTGIELSLDISFLELEVMLCFVAKPGAIFKVNKLAVALNLDFAVFVEYPNAEIVTEEFLQAGNGLLAAAGGAGNHGFEKLLHACCELTLAVFVYGKLLIAVSELCAACCEVLLALSELLFSVLECLFTGSDLCFAGCDCLFSLCELSKTVFILLELSFAVSYHVLHELGEVGYILGNFDAEVACNGANDLYKPCLSITEAGQSGEIAVAELDILVNIRHERLDLRKLFLAFIVSLGVVGDLLLTGFISLLALCKCLLALFELLLAGVILLVAVGKLALAVGISDEACLVGVNALEVNILVLHKLLDAVTGGCDAFPCHCRILFLVCLDVQYILHACNASEKTEQACKNQADAANHK